MFPARGWLKSVRSTMFLTKRNSSQFFYRARAVPTKKDLILANICGGFLWWWILYHLYYDYEQLLNHLPYPDPRKWTDEELGVPETEEMIRILQQNSRHEISE